MKKKNTTPSGTDNIPNAPVYWAFNDPRFNEPTPKEVEAWLLQCGSDTEAWRVVQELIVLGWNTPTQSLADVATFLEKVEAFIPQTEIPANSGWVFIIPGFRGAVHKAQREIEWLQSVLPERSYTLDDVFMMIRRHPPKTWGTTLDTFLDTIESYGYTGSLVDEEIDYLQTWKPKLEQEATNEIDRRFAAIPTEYSTEIENTADTITPERPSKPLTITGIVERELSNYSVDLSDAVVGNSIRGKYPDIVGDKDSWRCAVRDRRKKLRGKSGDSPERK